MHNRIPAQWEPLIGGQHLPRSALQLLNCLPSQFWDRCQALSPQEAHASADILASARRWVGSCAGSLLALACLYAFPKEELGEHGDKGAKGHRRPAALRWLPALPSRVANRNQARKPPPRRLAAYTEAGGQREQELGGQLEGSDLH